MCLKKIIILESSQCNVSKLRVKIIISYFTLEIIDIFNGPIDWGWINLGRNDCYITSPHYELIMYQELLNLTTTNVSVVNVKVITA